VPEISDDAKRNREDWTEANASYTDSAFVSNRFRVVQRRWHAARTIEAAMKRSAPAYRQP